MKNGDMIYEMYRTTLYKVKNIIRLNNDELFAFIKDAKSYFGNHDANCGIFLEKINYKNKYIDSNYYLENKFTFS